MLTWNSGETKMGGYAIIEETQDVNMKLIGVVLIGMLILVSCKPGAVPVVTETMSGTVTSFAAPTAVATPTSTIDLVQLESAAILFEQNFETGTLIGLSLSRHEWTLSTDDSGNTSLCNVPQDYYLGMSYGLGNWTDYAVEMRVEALEFQEDPYVALNVRYAPDLNVGYYGAINFQTNIADLSLSNPYTGFGNQNFTTKTNTWYTLRVEVSGQKIKFYINNSLIGQGTNGLLTRGMVGFFVSPHLKVCIDDIRVWALDSLGGIAQFPPTDQVVSDNPLSIYEGNCVFCFVDGSDPSMPIWDGIAQGYRPQPGDTREQVILDKNFNVPIGQISTFENKIIFIQTDQPWNINVYGTLIIKDSLLIWEQTGYSQARFQIKNGGTLSITNSYSFSGDRFWVNWGYEDGSTVILDHFVGDPWTTINGSVNYTAVNFSTVSLTIFSQVKNTTFNVTDAHHVWLELYPPPGIYEITFPAKHQWTDWTIPDIWPGTVISVAHSYIYERDISINNDVHVTILDTPSGFSLGWSISKDTPGFVDCELKDLGDPGNDQGVLYIDTTWDLPCNNSSLTVRNSLLQRAWPVVSGYIHMKILHSNLADPRNYSAPATYEIYDSTIGLIGAYSGGLVYIENSKIRDDIEVRGSNSIIYSYNISAVDPMNIFAILQQDGGRYIELETPGAPWK